MRRVDCGSLSPCAHCSVTASHVAIDWLVLWQVHFGHCHVPVSCWYVRAVSGTHESISSVPHRVDGTPPGYVVSDVTAGVVNAFPISRILHDILISLAWLFSLYILWREFRCAAHNNYVLRGWWLAECAVTILRLVTALSDESRSGSRGLYWVHTALSVLLAIMAAFPKNTTAESRLPMLASRKVSLLAWGSKAPETAEGRIFENVESQGLLSADGAGGGGGSGGGGGGKRPSVLEKKVCGRLGAAWYTTAIHC